jgi:hypothetical protein
VTGLRLRAAGAGDIMRRRRLVGASGRPLNFTVRPHFEATMRLVRGPCHQLRSAASSARLSMT